MIVSQTADSPETEVEMKVGNTSYPDEGFFVIEPVVEGLVAFVGRM
jgi:hypothetical protein